MYEQNEFSESKKKFERMFFDFSDVVYRLCLYKTGSPITAEDLTQDVFLRLWKSVSSGKIIDQPKSYIYQIARNLIVDYYQSKKTVSLDGLMDEGFESVSGEASPETLSEISMLRKTIESLEDDYREVIYLKFVEGLGVKEIGEIIGVSENLVSVRINRGKKKLEELLKKS